MKFDEHFFLKLLVALKNTILKKVGTKALVDVVLTLEQFLGILNLS
ncbi:MAG: hypothetical protein CM15mP44_7130 [Candidatus Neomarinimicrobiota bacterium]|nr:MAG: hypothetical protein CM15mP44_7130 [Candidatus Neomarinimicrobiota bacterium]